MEIIAVLNQKYIFTLILYNKPKYIFFNYDTFLKSECSNAYIGVIVMFILCLCI